MNHHILSGPYQQKKYKAFEIFLGMFTLVCLMNIYIWRHFLPNSACAKVDSAMVQWCDNDGAMTQWQWRKKSSLHCHHTIATSWSNHYHHSVIPSRHCITRHRVNVIATSRHHHRVIAPSAQPAMVRWCGNELRGLSGFLIFDWCLFEVILCRKIHLLIARSRATDLYLSYCIWKSIIV